VKAQAEISTIKKKSEKVGGGSVENSDLGKIEVESFKCSYLLRRINRSIGLKFLKSWLQKLSSRAKSTSSKL
jgi:hypothetical protein